MVPDWEFYTSFDSLEPETSTLQMIVSVGWWTKSLNQKWVVNNKHPCKTPPCMCASSCSFPWQKKIQMSSSFLEGVLLFFHQRSLTEMTLIERCWKGHCLEVPSKTDQKLSFESQLAERRSSPQMLSDLVVYSAKCLLPKKNLKGNDEPNFYFFVHIFVGGKWVRKFIYSDYTWNH